jgi:hypothetical protein
MDEPFVIELNYKGAPRAFEARLQVFGYSHRFHVDVDGIEVMLERDEEGAFRAILPQVNDRLPETALLQAIVEAIERILA